MAKKPRSQRRKKGSSLGETNAGDDDDDPNKNDELLSETHTIADDSVTSDFEADASEGGIDWFAPTDIEETESAAHQAAVSRHAKLQSALSMLTDYPSEKRSARREGQLRKTFKCLTQFATGIEGQECVESHIESIVTACTYGLRASGGPAEQYAACRVLEATAVVLGGNQDDFFGSLEAPLKRIVHMVGRAVPVRGAALRTLCLSNFINTDDDYQAEGLLDLCESVACSEFRHEAVPPNLRATALDCWALLATTIEDVYIAEKTDTSIGRGLVLLPLLKECLDTTHVELRSAAGECMALIHECRLNLGISEGDATERRFRRGSWDGSEWEVTMDEVKQRIAELSVESGHHLSKKAKKAQRSTFREFMATLVDDEPPCEIVNFRGGTLTLETWREVIQLNFIRHCLQGGFQIQLLCNATLHQVFGANGQLLSELANLSQLEKRMLLSKTSEASKAAHQKLTHDRKVRQNVKNHFLTSDGDEL